MKLEHAAEFVTLVSRLATRDDVGSAFGEWIAPHGFLGVSCGMALHTPVGLQYEFFFNTWPKDWLETYRAKDYVRQDIAPITARLTSRPFSWREIRAGREWSAPQRELHEWIDKIGIVDAFCVPFHEPGDDFALCVSLADHPIENEQERLALEILSVRAYRRCRELGGPSQGASAAAPLSAREVECMRWVLQGKSDKEIGVILDISPTTAHFHVERVKTKLGVKTRAQAAGQLVSLGYI